MRETEPEAFAVYLDMLCGQVRCKRAHGGLRRELGDHLEEQREALEAEGLPPEEAAAQAVASMGDPVETGQRLDRIHRPRMEWGVLIGVALLVALGCVLQLGIDASRGYPYLNLGYYLGPLAVGIPLLALVYWADYALLGRWSRALFWGYVAVIGVLVYTGYSKDVRGLALLMPLFLAGLLYRWRGGGWQTLVFGFAAFSVGFLTCSIFAGVIRSLVVLLACFALFATAILQGWTGLPRWKGLLMLFACTAALLILFSGMMGIGFSDWGRIFYRVFPWLAPEDAGGWRNPYSACLGVRELLSKAKWIGGIDPVTVGTGAEAVSYAGVLPYLYGLPELSGGMLVWVIGQYGLAAGLLVSAAILLVLGRMLWSALHIEAELGRMAAMACVLTFGAQTLLYLTANFGLHDLYGGSLPLMGGGWELIFHLVLAGVLLSCYRGKSLLRERVERKPVSYPRWMPRLEIKLHFPQYREGEVAQMIGLAPPPEEKEEDL